MLFNYRVYLDNAEELLQTYQEFASRPPRYVIHTPVLFYEWKKWADEKMDQRMRASHKNADKVSPLGQKIAPGWVYYEFTDMEDFYQYFQSLLIMKPEGEENA